MRIVHLSLMALLWCSCTVNINVPGGKDSTGSSPSPSPSPMPSINLGVNLEGLADWSRSYMFADVFKTARKFGSADKPYDENTPLTDKDGWPLTDFGTMLMTSTAHAEGTYHLVFQGSADVSVNATIKNKIYDAPTNTTTADVIVPATAVDISMSFRNTNGGIKNVRLYRPGIPTVNPPTFNPTFLTALKPFKTIRLMDYLNTNSTNVKNWSDRTRVESALYTLQNGGPIEPIIDLANLENKDLWINIPDQAGDDYVVELAKLLKLKLGPSQNIYLEYSNEVWNWQFPQAGRNRDAAKAEVLKGGSILNKDGEVNEIYWAWRRVAKRALEIEEIFKSVYGADSINKNIRVILASQVAWQYILKHQLEFISKNYGAPKNFFYGVAGAPYFGPGAEAEKTDTTKEKLLLATEKAMSTYYETYASYYSMAQAYGLKNISYEGGWDSGQNTTNVAARIAASSDPKAGELVENYLSNWFGCGGDMMMYFTFTSLWNQWGQWGLTDDIAQTSAKLQGALNVLKANPNTFECGPNRMHSSLGALGKGTGLSAEYFSDQMLTKSVVKRVDPVINFIWGGEWGTGTPDPLISYSGWSARWSGQIMPKYSESYTFSTSTDDGVKLWINGQLLIDDWTSHPVKENSGVIVLEAGKLYDLKMEYYSTQQGSARLSWASASQPKGVVAASSLYPAK